MVRSPDFPFAGANLRRTRFCLRSPAPRGLAGMRLRVSLQFAVYDDQVNVVQVDHAGRRGSLLFVPGDGPRRLP